MVVHGEKLGHNNGTTESILHGSFGSMQAASSTTTKAVVAALEDVIMPHVCRCMLYINTLMIPRALGGHQNVSKYFTLLGCYTTIPLLMCSSSNRI